MGSLHYNSEDDLPLVFIPAPCDPNNQCFVIAELRSVSIITQKMIFLSPLFLLPVILTTNAGSVSDEALTYTNMVDSQTCLLCELIVQVVDFALESEGSIDQIRTLLFGLCDSLQPGMEEDCKAIIHQLDLNTIIDIIVELGLRPKAVCEYLGICP